MKTQDLDRELKAANPFPSQALAALDIASAEAELGEAILAGSASAGDGRRPPALRTPTARGG